MNLMASNTIEPLASSSPLIAYIDFKSPYAYLALAPTCALEDELGIAIDWRPFTLDIASYLGSARLNQEGKVVENNRAPGQWAKVKYAYHDVRRYGSFRGMVVRGTTKIWNSSLAGIGLLWARELDRPVFRAYANLIYERFWKRDLDIENIAVIESVLAQAGAPTRGFRDYASAEGRELHDHIQRTAFDAGIFGVPTYVIDGEMFFGREHLPRIRWMLTGRVGAPPDVAYQDIPAVHEPTRAGIESQMAVAIDFKSPHAYLALGPTCAMADDLGISIDWMPLIVSSPDSSRGSSEDRGARHRRIRADYIKRDLFRYAADRGLELSGFYRAQDSTLAAIALLWVRRESPSLMRKYVESVFQGIAHSALAVEDERSICALLVEIGAPVTGFEAFARHEGRTELAAIKSRLQEIGVFEVPTYVVNGDAFLGRQHLPLLRSMLAARQTATPA
jgi:2-hydroxychromene-2-carboxylate isomerase